MKLNIGCGETKLEGFINIDIEDSTKPDLILDLKKEPFPYPNDSVDQINCLHNLEHIELKYWNQVLSEFYRVLKPEGKLLLAYPEFEICARYFLENERGLRDFWRSTLYGRQLYPGDYHVVPMRTIEVVTFLENTGFHYIKYGPEFDQPHNTFVIAHKGPVPKTRADVLRDELFAI